MSWTVEVGYEKIDVTKHVSVVAVAAVLLLRVLQVFIKML